MVAYFFSWLPEVGSSTKHTFVSHNSNSKVVNRACMILSAHNFWCHIAWRARSILGVIFPPDSGYTEVCYPNITITFNDQIFGFYVSVYYVFLMDVLEACYETGNKKSGGFLIESSILTNVVPQVSPWEVIHNQVQIFAVLECILHINDVNVLKLCKDLSFIDDGLDWPFGDDACFWHFFHRKWLSLFLALNLPDFTEAAFANAVVVNKVGFRNSEGGALKRPLPIIHHFKCS